MSPPPSTHSGAKTDQDTRLQEFPPFTRGAAVYDRFHRSKNYLAEARMVSHHLCDGGRPPGSTHVLEFGAGTGAMTKALRGLGHRVTATEPSADMRREIGSAGAINLEISGKRPAGQMLDPLETEYDGAVAHFTVVSYACLTLDRLFEAAGFVRSKLRPGAAWVFDVINYAAAASSLREYEHQNASEGRKEGDHRVVKKWFDVSTGVITYSIVYDIGGQRWREIHLQRAFTPAEISHVLHASRFDVRLQFDPAERDPGEDNRLTRFSWTNQVVARAV